ncbi:MAG: toxin-antitoxin system YwqK family antitoxin [Bacteroidia bacterium]
MKNIIYTLAILTGLLPVTSMSQTLYKSCYDYQKTHVKEEYYANSYGVKNGTYTLYSEYGGIIQLGTYKNDGKIGKWIEKDEKGKLVLEENYDNNSQYNGQVVRYNDGVKYLENYKHGIKNGNWKTWFFNENRYTIYVDEYYKDGLQDSVKKQYDTQGVLLSKVTYKYGVEKYKVVYESENLKYIAIYDSLGLKIFEKSWNNPVINKDSIAYYIAYFSSPQQVAEFTRQKHYMDFSVFQEWKKQAEAFFDAKNYYDANKDYNVIINNVKDGIWAIPNASLDSIYNEKRRMSGMGMQ